MTQGDTEPNGNTKHSVRSRKWCFTLNNYNNDDIDTLTQAFKDDKYIFQEEKASTAHLQGYVEFKNPRTFKSLKNKFPSIHWERCRNETAAIKYCSKEETRVGKIFTNIKEKYKCKIDKLKPWQQEIVDIINTKPDDRTIYWYWEPIGNVGKTEFIKYLLTNYNNTIFSRANKSADILTIASEDKNVYLLDFARSQEGFAPWNALEQLKDGLISDSKLKKKTINIVMERPHVICFANWEPNRDLISKDKLTVIQIED